MMKSILLVAFLAGSVLAATAVSRPPHSDFRLRRAQARATAAIRAKASQFGSDAELNTTAPDAGSYGIDISGATCDGGSWISSTQFPCFKSKGVSHAIVESHNGGLGPTQSIKHCTDAAHAANYAAVDVYAFFCPNCGGNNPPKTAMADHVRSLKSQGVDFGRIWLDIETCSGCWNDAASNAAYIKALTEGAASAGAHIGIYTNENEWSQVCGSNHDFSAYPLWYAHYDGNPNFGDFAPFAGWTKPYMKQYMDQSTVGCYSGVDMDWRP